MEILYDWLLHNMGNEANFYTILNCQRHHVSDRSDDLEIMIRPSDFSVVYVLLYEGQNTDTTAIKSDWLQGKTQKDSYIFGGPQQLIDFFSSGQMPEPMDAASTGIHVIVAEPNPEAGATTFP